DKGVHQVSTFFVDTPLHFRAESAAQEIDGWRSSHRKHARCDVAQTGTDIFGAESRRDEPRVPEWVRNKSGALTIGPVSGLTHGRTNCHGSGVEGSLVRGVAVLHIDV